MPPIVDVAVGGRDVEVPDHQQRPRRVERVAQPPCQRVQPFELQLVLG